MGGASDTGFWIPTLSPRSTRAPKMRGADPPKPPSGRSSTITESPRRRLDKDVLASALHYDLLGVFQAAHDVHDALLRLFHLAESDGTADLHLLLEGLRRS